MNFVYDIRQLLWSCYLPKLKLRDPRLLERKELDPKLRLVLPNIELLELEDPLRWEEPRRLTLLLLLVPNEEVDPLGDVTVPEAALLDLPKPPDLRFCLLAAWNCFCVEVGFLRERVMPFFATFPLSGFLIVVGDVR